MKTALIFAAIAALGLPSHAQRVIGSDSMVLLAAAWAEKYGAGEISGGGSGIGAAALINESADVGMLTRELAAEETKKLTEKYGGPPVVTTVAYDALAIFVHKDNPVKQITFEDLREIFLDGGRIGDWKDLEAAQFGEIVPVGQGANTGSHQYFREAVGGKLAVMKADVRSLSGAADVVATCAKTPASIAFAGLGFAQAGVKALPFAKGKDGKPVAPTPATVRDGSYPLGRKFYFVTTPKADAATKKFVAFVTGAAGQKVAADNGFVPLAQ